MLTRAISQQVEVIKIQKTHKHQFTAKDWIVGRVNIPSEWSLVLDAISKNDIKLNHYLVDIYFDYNEERWVPPELINFFSNSRHLKLFTNFYLMQTIFGFDFRTKKEFQTFCYSIEHLEPFFNDWNDFFRLE